MRVCDAAASPPMESIRRDARYRFPALAARIFLSAHRTASQRRPRASGAAIETEVAALRGQHADRRQRLMRHRHLPERELTTGTDPSPVLLPLRRHRQHCVGAHKIARRSAGDLAAARVHHGSEIRPVCALVGPGDFNTPEAARATRPEDSDRTGAPRSADRGGDIARGCRGHRPRADTYCRLLRYPALIDF